MVTMTTMILYHYYSGENPLNAHLHSYPVRVDDLYP